MNEELVAGAGDLALRCQTLAGQIVNERSVQQAGELILAGKGMVKKIKDYFRPLKQAQDDAKARLLGAERAELRKIEPALEVLSRAVAAWIQGEERKRREAEEKARRAEEERKKLEETALAAAEAAAPADQDRILEAAAARERELAPAPIIPAAVRLAGLTSRVTWKAEVTDIRHLAIAALEGQVSIEAIQANEVYLNGRAALLKDKASIPGVRVYKETSLARTRR